MDLVSPAPPYVLVTLTKAVWKVIETQPAISNRGCRGDWRTGSTRIYPGSRLYTPVTLQLQKLIIQLYPVHGVGVTVEARLNLSLQAGTSLITTDGFHPKEAKSATSEAIDHTAVTVQLLRLMSPQ
jgi:hypothetical protein